MAIYALDGIVPTLPGDGRYWIAPSASVIGGIELGDDVGVWFGAVLRGDGEPIVVERETNIQDLAVVHTDPDCPVAVGRGCTIGHRAILHGCTIGNNTLVGMGAIILNRARVADDCLVAAGALIPEGREIPPGSLVMGVPAKVVRPLTPDEIGRNRISAAHYVANWKRFAKALRPA